MNELQEAIIIVFMGISLASVNYMMLVILKEIKKQESYTDARIGVLYTLLKEELKKIKEDK